MRRTLIQGVAAVGIAAIFASPAGAQPPTPTPRAPGAVTGEMWLSATPDVRRAFLAGAGNMIALETAYARRKNVAVAAPDSATAALGACATAGGAAIGAGVGSLSGNTESGALIGGAAGALVDIC